ncbi:MAG: fasciclin domain-containing protein [Promethearchaeota archaeon]
MENIKMSNIIEVARKEGGFSTLLKAIEVAGLVDTLSNDGPFTLFAPTDDAFSKLPSETLKELLNEPEKLKNILLFHIVKGKIMTSAAKDMTEPMEVETLQGKKLKLDPFKHLINDKAQFVKPDVEASNGVIHIIDAVLFPS